MKTYRPALKNDAKWLTTHTKKSIKNSDEETLYDNFFFGIEDKDKQGDILELYFDCYHNDILHRIDLIALSSSYLGFEFWWLAPQLWSAKAAATHAPAT